MNTQAIDYKSTLRLPKTTFPMRAGLPQKEPGILSGWDEIGVYDRLRAKEGRETFILHDGPPYANGHLHIGHALNKVLKDFVVRSQQQMGKDSRYVPGWDCHGLPIEWKVEENYRERGLYKEDVSILDLRRECREFAKNWINIQRLEFCRLGVIGKWNDPYLTMDYHAEAVIAEEFMKFLMNGTLYQGSKPVLWSTVEKTALAEAEVEYEDHTSQSIWVRFPVDTTLSKDLAKADIPEDTSVIIWTTTAWTIPSNKAICFNPNITYSLYEVTEAPEDNWFGKGEYFLLADNLIEETARVSRITAYKKIKTVSSEELARLVCEHPFRGMVSEQEPDVNRWDYAVPLLPGDHVTDEAGTGFVHTAPSHGDDDFLIARKHNLHMTHNVNEDGRFRSSLPIFGGLEIFNSNGKEGAANNIIIANLITKGKLVARRKLVHSYPHSWRSKAPLIYRNTPQWFVAIDKEVDDNQSGEGKTIRERALNTINHRVKWTPQSGQNRINSMLEKRPDWVLSRQRAWGVPLTCFIRKGASPGAKDLLLRDQRVNERISAMIKEGGADTWYEENTREKILEGLYKPEDYEQITDILDVWFDSGSTHAFVLRDRDDGSHDGMADLYLEGTDQHRGWFQSSLLQSCGTNGRAPYRGVLTHGFTLDEKGKKMSKSLGNTVSPEELVKKHGADILRLWVAQSDYTSDLRIGPNILQTVIDSYRRLRNAFRFILGNLHDNCEVEEIDWTTMPDLERWVLHRICELDETVRNGYAEYDFRSVYSQIFNFLNTDLSRFYFDIRKDSLYCGYPESQQYKATLMVLDILFNFLTTWLAPILPFTMEEIWQSRNPSSSDSVHLHDFPQAKTDWRNDDLAKKWEKIREVRRVVNAEIENQRAAKVIGSSLEVHPRILVEDEELYNLLTSVPLDDVCITSQIDVVKVTSMENKSGTDGNNGFRVEFNHAKGDKCQRCWKILPEVGSFFHQGVCARCDEVLTLLKTSD